jgi:hypothetical protein
MEKPRRIVARPPSGSPAGLFERLGKSRIPMPTSSIPVSDVYILPPISSRESSQSAHAGDMTG